MSWARNLAMQKYLSHSVTERKPAARPRTRRRGTAISNLKLKRREQPMENLNRFQRFRKVGITSSSEEQILHLIIAKRPRKYPLLGLEKWNTESIYGPGCLS